MPETKLDWCLSNKNRLRKIQPSSQQAAEHINKAKHNLLAADYNIKGNFNDWAVSQCYYAMYHGLLSLLCKFGFESKNHECTFEAVKYLIETKKINLSLGDIAFIKTTEQMKAQDAKSLREEFQYGTKTDVNREILNELVKRAKEIVEKIEIIITSDAKAI